MAVLGPFRQRCIATCTVAVDNQRGHLELSLGSFHEPLPVENASRARLSSSQPHCLIECPSLGNELACTKEPREVLQSAMGRKDACQEIVEAYRVAIGSY